MHSTLVDVTIRVKVMPEVNRAMEDIADEVTASCEVAAMEFGEVVAASFALDDLVDRSGGVRSDPGGAEDDESEVSPPHLTLVPSIKDDHSHQGQGQGQGAGFDLMSDDVLHVLRSVGIQLDAEVG